MKDNLENTHKNTTKPDLYTNKNIKILHPLINYSSAL
jgi:hypothetical protein